MNTLCRDCGAPAPGGPDGQTARCASCASPRLIAHDELDQLAIAHIDCDAFYASIEKRDAPELADKPVIVGGGKRGVVAAACYIARLQGVKSAMPMYRALKACPGAVVRRPDMAKYRAVGQQIRQLMLQVTPLVEPLSVDEAFLDLSGTEMLHGGSPARTLIGLIGRIESEIGITASVGLSYNKFLAKTASDLDKPRGFAIIGKAEALDFLAPRPVGTIWGVGKARGARLARDGLKTIGQLRSLDEKELLARYGVIGRRLAGLSWAQDDRRVSPNAGAKSVSVEYTFSTDTGDPRTLAHRLWPLCEQLSKRLKTKQLSTGGVTLKMKTENFRLITRSKRLASPTQLADMLYATALPLLESLADGRRFRLLGIGAGYLAAAEEADLPGLLDGETQARARLEGAMDELRAKYGDPAVQKGRSLLSS